MFNDKGFDISFSNLKVFVYFKLKLYLNKIVISKFQSVLLGTLLLLA